MIISAIVVVIIIIAPLFFFQKRRFNPHTKQHDHDIHTYILPPFQNRSRGFSSRHMNASIHPSCSGAAHAWPRPTKPPGSNNASDNRARFRPTPQPNPRQWNGGGWRLRSDAELTQRPPGRWVSDPATRARLIWFRVRVNWCQLCAREHTQSERVRV